MKIHEEHNLAYLVRTDTLHIGKRKVNKLREIALASIWNQIMEEYIKRFGFTEEYLEIVRKQKEIAQHQMKRIITGDRTIETFIQICKNELKQMQNDMTGSNFWELKGHIEKGMGFVINPMRVTVAEFYSYIKILEKQAKRTRNG